MHKSNSKKLSISRLGNFNLKFTSELRNAIFMNLLFLNYEEVTWFIAKVNTKEIENIYSWALNWLFQPKLENTIFVKSTSVEYLKCYLFSFFSDDGVSSLKVGSRVDQSDRTCWWISRIRTLSNLSAGIKPFNLIIHNWFFFIFRVLLALTLSQMIMRY